MKKIVLLLLMILSSSLKAKADNENTSFRDILGQEIRYATISDPNFFDTTEFRELLAQNDSSGVFDHEFSPRSVSQSDAIIYFLKTWEDVSKVPGAASFRGIVSIVQELELDKNIVSFELTNNSEPYVILFVKTGIEISDHSRLNCLSESIISYFITPTSELSSSNRCD